MSGRLTRAGGQAIAAGQLIFGGTAGRGNSSRCPVEDGAFSLTTGMIEALTLWGFSSTEVDETLSKWRYGQRWWPQCPSGAVRLTRSSGSTFD